jgi:protein-disulfide reductase (glutathione)
MGTKTMMVLVAGVLAMTSACLEAPGGAEPAESVPPSSEADVASAAQPQRVIPAMAPKTPPPAKPAGGNLAEWPTSIAWTDYETGLATAKSTNKPIFLLIYADWCPKCRALAPEMADPELVELSKSFVMVKQDQEAKPAWLDRYNGLGGYVPRIFFLKPDGSVREEINSGHPRYPYFFAAQQIPKLKETMQAAK